MYSLYYLYRNEERLLKQCDSLVEAEIVASSFGYMYYKIRSTEKDICLVGVRGSINIDSEHSFIQWRINPPRRTGGPKKL